MKKFVLAAALLAATASASAADDLSGAWRFKSLQCSDGSAVNFGTDVQVKISGMMILTENQYMNTLSVDASAQGMTSNCTQTSGGSYSAMSGKLFMAPSSHEESEGCGSTEEEKKESLKPDVTSYSLSGNTLTIISESDDTDASICPSKDVRVIYERQ